MLTVFAWTPEVIADWLTHGQPYMDDGIDLFPSERGALASGKSARSRTDAVTDEQDLGLHTARDPYYVT